MAMSVAFTLLRRDGALPLLRLDLLLLYFFGGLFSWPVALIAVRLVIHPCRAKAIFAWHLLALMTATIGMTAFLFAMHYRLFYSQWHAPFATRIWTLQFIFTSISAVYQFLVLGSVLLLPLGLVFVVGAAFYLSRRMR